MRWSLFSNEELIELWAGLGSSNDEGLAYDYAMNERLAQELEDVLRGRGLDVWALPHPMAPRS